MLPNADALPVIFVTVADAMRFANWLHHGKGHADTENGAYLLAKGALPDTHQPDAQYWVPTKNEWYNAAYHHHASAGGPQNHYWLYPTQSIHPPLQERRGGRTPQSASFLDLTIHHPSYAFLNPVGSHPLSPSHYDAFDQGGSVWEWTETPRLENERVLRGGSFSKPVAALRSVMRIGCRPDLPQRDVGFRLARRLPQPQPATTAATNPPAPDLPSKLQPLLDALGISSRNASGTVIHPRYFEASPTEFRDFVYEARVPRAHTLQIAPYRIIPDQLGEEGGKFPGMCAVIESIEIQGPLFEQWPPRGHRLLYGDLPLRGCPPREDGSRLEVASTQPEVDARKILASALPKLFRRPVSDAELQEVLAPFQEQSLPDSG